MSDDTKSATLKLPDQTKYTVTAEMIEAGWRAYWAAGIATKGEKLAAAYCAMRALEPVTT